MDTKFDLTQILSVTTVDSVRKGLVDYFRERRKSLRITQKELAKRSGVSYGSIRRFESLGEISLYSLLCMADALGILEDFNKVFETKKPTDLNDL